MYVPYFLIGVTEMNICQHKSESVKNQEYIIWVQWVLEDAFASSSKNDLAVAFTTSTSCVKSCFKRFEIPEEYFYVNANLVVKVSNLSCNWFRHVKGPYLRKRAHTNMQ